MNEKFMATIKIGSKGQLVIPKEVREMFGIAPGDTVLLMADKEKGIAIVNYAAYRDLADVVLGGGKKAASKRGSQSWEKFLKDHPDREIK